MRIFFFTTVFAPSVGGVERMTEMLCGEFTALGHEVLLATLTPGESNFPYPVIRRPRLLDFLRLLRWCDIHVQANVSLKYAWAGILAPRRLVYQHHCAYRRDDGTLSVLGRAKVTLATLSHGISNSEYTADRIGCDEAILNSYEDAVFRVSRPWFERASDFVFLGRLVSQKGCDTLIRALARLRGQGLTPSLTIIGDGPDRPMLDALSKREGLVGQVRFAGVLKGHSLAEVLNQHRVIIVPSRCEEPFGIVALEGLACGCVPVVSARGGLVDAISGHGFTFPNGDDAALADTLAGILADPAAAHARLAGADAHLSRCTSQAVAMRYLDVFEGVLAQRRGTRRA